jgi:hypothetical protein
MKWVVILLLLFSLLSCRGNKYYQTAAIDTVASEEQIAENGSNMDIITEEQLRKQNNEDTAVVSEDIGSDIYEQNETCAMIVQMYYQALAAEEMYWDSSSEDDYIYYEEKYGITRENRETFSEKLELVPKLLVDFFKTEESWHIDVKKELPFIKYFSVSSDGMLRIYNWDNRENGTGDTFQNIIQYRTEAGAINAVYCDELRDLRFGYGGVAYWVGGKLKEKAYLLTGVGRGGGFYANGSYVAIEITDDKLLPYPAFNGENNLAFHYLV